MPKANRLEENNSTGKKKKPVTEYRPVIKNASSDIQQAHKVVMDDIYQLRRQLDEKELEPDSQPPQIELTTEASEIFKPKPECLPIQFTNLRSISTGLIDVHTTVASGKYVYITGVEGSDPTLKIYRITFDNELELVSSLILSQECHRLVKQGHYLYGCNNGSTSNLLLSIDIIDPANPIEVDSLDVGDDAKGLHTQGRYVYVAANGNIKIIDISIPTAAVVVGTL